MEIKAYRWYGGKIRMVNIINFLIPEHTAYYEPFMGSAAVLLNHPRSQLEVVNDLDTDIAHFMRTLADREKGKILVDKLSRLRYGKAEFDEAMECKKRNFRDMNDIDKAVKVFILITQSFNSTRKSFSASAYKDTYAYREDIQFHIPKVYERLENVRVKNMNGIDLLGKIANNANAFAFVDPPYRHELRGMGANKAYNCELPHCEQIRLLKTIREAVCKVMLCGYRVESGVDLYDRYLIPYGWKCYKLTDIVKAAQVSKTHKSIGSEFIWVNFKLPKGAKYAINLKQYNSLEE